MFGFLNVNKILGQTSREAVDVVSTSIRRAMGRKLKLGHAGTLDPLATGVLVIAVGPATRLIHFVQQQTKTYLGTFRLGVTSETLDLESEMQPLAQAPVINRVQLISALDQFVGRIEQVPPVFSANKFNGKRGYVLARQGKAVEPKPKIVEIFQIDLIELEYPVFSIRIQCGSGTYIRSLGRDIARSVNSDAVMISLTRESIGPFPLSESIDLGNETDLFERIQDGLSPPERVLSDIPNFQLSASQVKAVFNGTKLDLPDMPDAKQLVGFDSQDRLIAVFERSSDGSYRPAINFSGYHGCESTKD